MVKEKINESGKVESLTIGFEFSKNNYLPLMRREWVGKIKYNPAKWEKFPFNIEFCKFKSYEQQDKNFANVTVELISDPGSGKVWCVNMAPRRYYNADLNEITLKEAIELLKAKSGGAVALLDSDFNR